jgi:tetratricopeptide (TPR) repeat protein
VNEREPHQTRLWTTLAVAGIVAMAMHGCASAPPRQRPPEMEEYVFPYPEPGSLRTGDDKRLRDAWNKIVSGHAAAAEKKMEKLRARNPRAAAPLAGLGYAQLRARQPQLALSSFRRALEKSPEYIPALAGGALAARRAGLLDDALGLYELWLKASAEELPNVRRRYSEVRLQVTDAHIAAAQQALDAGTPDVAIEQFRAALGVAPELSGVRLQLAETLVAADDVGAAIEVLSAEPGADRAVLLRLAELLASVEDHAGALMAYERLLAQDPADEGVRRKAAEARRTIEFLQMPEEYRRIYTAPSVTRADLAALLAVKVSSLARLAVGGEPPVATDISGSWAREHVIRMLALGVMETYPNHTFHPAATVRRGELALSVARVLDLAGWPSRPGPLISDMSRAHLHYGAASRVVTAGLMALTPTGAFEPWKPVTGPEAVRVVDSLASLIQR